MSHNLDSSNTFELDKWVEEMLWDETDEEMGTYLLQQYDENRSRKEVLRDRQDAAQRLYNEYFSPTSMFDGDDFRRRFWIRRELFIRIADALGNHTVYFTQRVDAAKRLGLSPLQKCTAAMRMLAYGTAANSLDEYLKLGESTVTECLFEFCRAVIEVFAGVYMRKPDANDVKRITQMHEECHGFPGMLGSLDCMHWAWKNCPTAFGRDSTHVVIMATQLSCLKRSLL